MLTLLVPTLACRKFMIAGVDASREMIGAVSVSVTKIERGSQVVSAGGQR